MRGKRAREFRKMLGYDYKDEREVGRNYIQVPCARGIPRDGKAKLYTMIRVKDMKRVRYQLYKKFYREMRDDLRNLR